MRLAEKLDWKGLIAWAALYITVKTVAREASGWRLFGERRGFLNNSPHRIFVMTGLRTLQCTAIFVASPFCRKSVTCDKDEKSEPNTTFESIILFTRCRLEVTTCFGLLL
jgi:hypothetical protein